MNKDTAEHPSREKNIGEQSEKWPMGDRLKRVSRHRNFWFGFVVLIVISLVGGIFFAKSLAVASLNEQQDMMVRALTVHATIIQAENDYKVQQQYSGKIVAGRESDHGFDRGGILAEILVDEGARVKKGDILARLDMRRIEARSVELDADLAQAIALDHEASAQIAQAKANYDRYAILLDKKHVSAQKFDQVKYDLESVQARKGATQSAVQRVRAALKALGVDRQMATLTARFGGSVLRRYHDEGAALGSGAPVVRLIEDQRLEIHVGLPQKAVLMAGPDEVVMFDYQDRKIATKLRTVLPQVDSSTRTVMAIFDITEENPDIRVGSLAQLSVAGEIQQAGFWVPSSALAESRRGLWSAYTLKDYDDRREFGTVQRQELQVLHMESDRVFVRGTLQNGDRVVTAGTHRLVPGQLVRIRGGNE